MTAGYSGYTCLIQRKQSALFAMADALTIQKGCISSCFTLDAQKAQRKELINRLSGLLFAKTWTSVTSSFSVDVVEVDKSLSKSETSISVPADSVNKHSLTVFGT